MGRWRLGAIVLALACLPVLAAADTSTGTVDDSGGSAGATTDATTTGTDASDDGATATATATDDGDDCGGCNPDAAMQVAILVPQDGAEVPAAFKVVWEATDACACDDCGCVALPAERREVLIDGQPAATCDAAMCTVDVVADPGLRTITVQADYGGLVIRASVAVLVVGEAVDPGADGSSGGDAGAADDGADGGCGCRQSGPGRSVPAALLSLALAVPLGRRRRP